MAVVIMFALCWLPIHVIMVMRALQVYINTPLSITIQVEKGLIKNLLYFINQNIMKTIHVIIQLLISCIRSLAIFWLTPTHASTPFYMPFFRNHSVEDFGQ